jgi:hypothetical protein
VGSVLFAIRRQVNDSCSGLRTAENSAAPVTLGTRIIRNIEQNVRLKMELRLNALLITRISASISLSLKNLMS